jgi:hypothetical protein
MKDEALKLALDDLIAEYQMETSSFAKRADEIFKQALAQPAVQEPVAWLEILRNNKTATDEVIGAFLRGHAEHLTGETFVLATPPAQQALAAQPAPVQPVAHIVGEIDHTGKVWKPVQPAPVPIKPIVDPGLDVNQRLAFKLGWKSAEEAHGITKGQP